MGWKSSKEITREKALRDIYNHLEDLSDTELGYVMSTMFGDDTNLPHFGCNITIVEENNSKT